MKYRLEHLILTRTKKEIKCDSWNPCPWWHLAWSHTEAQKETCCHAAAALGDAKVQEFRHVCAAGTAIPLPLQGGSSRSGSLCDNKEV